jgi:drug/metabolite transporter (DMT)-like permease
MTGILFALASAFSWGAGDFGGGVATRKSNQFQVLLVTSSSSLLMLTLFAVLSTENMPSTRDLVFSVLAGISGAMGLAALYRGLSFGNSALVAPVAGVIGAIIPTLAGLIIHGLPSILMLTGFGLAVLGIWLVTRSQEGKGNNGQDGLGLAVLAGFGFGGFLTLISQIEGEGILTPLVFSKMASLVLALVIIRMRRLPFPNPARSPLAIVSGFLDAGGNILYLAATQLVRLDVAALLSSFYPGVTVLLSGLILHEKISWNQWLGTGTCIAAIILITLG